MTGGAQRREELRETPEGVRAVLEALRRQAAAGVAVERRADDVEPLPGDGVEVRAQAPAGVVLGVERHRHQAQVAGVGDVVVVERPAGLLDVGDERRVVRPSAR